MTLSVAPREQLSADPPQTKEEAVFMFEVGEECQRRALRYLVEVADMSYGDIVKLAQEANSNSRITKRKLQYLAEKMKADGEPLKTKQPERLKAANEARKRVGQNCATPVENSEPRIERVTVTVEDPPKPTALRVGASETIEADTQGAASKAHPEAVAIGQPVMPAPKPKPEDPLTPTGQISQETKDIVSKEKKCLQQKIEQVKQLDELNEQFTVYWRHLQKNWTKQGRSVVKMHREVAEKIFLRDGTMQPLAEALGLPKTASLEDCLWGMQARAKKLESSIRSALCFYYYIESMTVEQRPE
jgi:hypothetical protein